MDRSWYVDQTLQRSSFVELAPSEPLMFGFWQVASEKSER